MPEAARDPGFTAEEVCAQARGNASALILVLLAYARNRGDDPAAAARFVGERFAPSWDGLRGEGALAAARAAALNLVTGGAELRVLAGDGDRAEATVAGWPGEEDLAFFGLTRADADAFHGVFGAAAERLGLRFAWHRDGDAVALAFVRDAAAPSTP